MMSSMKSSIVALVVLGSLWASAASAHPEGVTLTSIWVAQEGVRLEIVIPDRFFARDGAGGAFDSSPDGQAGLAGRVEAGLTLEADRKDCPLRREAAAWRLPDIGSHRYVLEFDCSASAAQLVLRDRLAAAATQSGHENFVKASVSGIERTAILTPAEPHFVLPVGEMLRESGTSLAASLPRDEVLSPDPIGFIMLGAEHILQGIDHVLFLVGLFLIAMPWRRLLGIVTAFTVGHSVTLGLSVLGIYSPTPWIAESVIALSIVYLAIENLLTLRHQSSEQQLAVGTRDDATRTSRAARTRWAIAGGFGLIHGFGFSYVLRDLGLPADSALTSLAGFNLGVELGQLVVVAILLPALFVAWRQISYRGVSIAGSLSIGLIGCWWLVERTMLSAG